MKPISIKQVNSLISSRQYFHDCYLVSSLSALARCKNGRRILRENILTDGEAFCIRFRNVNGQAENYLVKQEECDNLILTNKYLEPIPLEEPINPIVKAVEVAVNKLLKLHPDKKPFYSRIENSYEDFEYNKPSNFLTMFTGVRPITINEVTLKNSLKSQQDKAENLLNMISKDDNSAFILGTGFKFIPTKLSSWHCYNIIYTDNKKGIVKILDNRRKETLLISYDDVIGKFKFICGYFNESLSSHHCDV